MATNPSSSLVVGPFDLLDTFTPSPVKLVRGFDRGYGVPQLSEVQSTVLDGANVTGQTAANRKIIMPVVIQGADRLTIAQLANSLATFVNQPTWNMPFTPVGGFPVIFECFHASATPITSPMSDDNGGNQQMRLEFEARPFPRSPNPVTVSLVGSVPVLLDGFDSSTAPTVTTTSAATSGVGKGEGVYQDATNGPVYAGAAALHIKYVNPNQPFPPGPSAFGFTVSRSVSATVTAAGVSYVRVQLGAGGSTAGYPALNFSAASITLNSSTTSYTSTGFTGTTSGSSGTFAEMDLAITVPAGVTITSYTLALTCPASARSNNNLRQLDIDVLQMVPATSAAVSDSQGAVFSIPNVVGTARTPVALDLTSASSATFGRCLIHLPPTDRPTAVPMIALNPATAGTVVGTSTGRYDGTYSIYVATNTFGSAGTARTITVTAAQTGGISQQVSLSYTPASGSGPQLLNIGDMHLPLTAYPAENTATTTFTITSSVSTDTFNDILLIDTRGTTVAVSSTSQLALEFWKDAPGPLQSSGNAYSGAARSSATAAILSRDGVLYAYPGSNQVLVFCPTGALTGKATYYPRWLQEATA